MTNATIFRADVPPVDQLRPREDTFVVHEIAEITNETATGALVRHVAAGGKVTWSVSRFDAFDANDCDTLEAVEDAAEVLDFLVAELREALAGRR